MKLGLGTVQFGCNYGISNTNGQVSIEEVKSILNSAKANGIDLLDTASLYGNSESVLGSFDLKDFNVVTKTIKIDKNLSDTENIEAFKNALLNSRHNLGDIELYGIMFHEANDLLSDIGNELWDLLLDFQKNGYVKKIGVSVYTPSQLLEIINRYKIQLVQFPLNILDQRFLEIIDYIKKRNIEIHTRSTFLQGLLLMKFYDIGDYFDEIKPILSQIPSPKLAYALDFVKNIKEVDKIILGTTKESELQEIITMYNQNVKKLDYSKFKTINEKFILPQNWQK